MEHLTAHPECDYPPEEAAPDAIRPPGRQDYPTLGDFLDAYREYLDAVREPIPMPDTEPEGVPAGVCPHCGQPLRECEYLPGPEIYYYTCDCRA